MVELRADLNLGCMCVKQSIFLKNLFQILSFPFLSTFQKLSHAFIKQPSPQYLKYKSYTFIMLKFEAQVQSTAIGFSYPFLFIYFISNYILTYSTSSYTLPLNSIPKKSYMEPIPHYFSIVSNSDLNSPLLD